MSTPLPYATESDLAAALCALVHKLDQENPPAMTTEMIVYGEHGVITVSATRKVYR